MAYFDRELIGRIVRLALPTVTMNMLQQTVQIADTVMIARSPVGAIGNAALGISLPITYVVVTMILAVTAGAMSLVAQRVGAREPGQAAHVAKQSLTLAFGFGIILSAFGWFAAPWGAGLVNAGGDPEVTRLAGVYLQTLFAGGIPLFGTFAITSLMLGAGDGVTPLKVYALMNAINIALNAVLIYGLGPFPELGVQGAALASVLARTVGLTVGLWLLWRGTRRLSLAAGGTWRPESVTAGRIFRIGLPSAVQAFFQTGSYTLNVAIVTSTAAGSLGAAAMNIGGTIDGFGLMIVFAILVAASSLVGQALGAWQVREARRRATAIAILAAGLLTIVAAAMILAAPVLVDIFIRPDQPPQDIAAVRSLGVLYLRVIAVGLPFFAVALVLTGALRGAGDSFRPMVLTGISRWLVTIPLAWTLAIPLGVGAPGVFWAVTLGHVVHCLGVYWLFRSPDWHLVALRNQDANAVYQALGPGDRGLFLALREQLMAPLGSRESVVGSSATYRLGDHAVTIAARDGRLVMEAPAGDLVTDPAGQTALAASFASLTIGDRPSSTATRTIN